MHEQTIINMIKPWVCPAVLHFLEERGGFIAGGAMTSILTRSKINDVDIYLTSEKDIKDFIIEFDRICYFTDKSVSFNIGNMARPIHQLITIDVYQKAEEIFDHFDFTINMVAWDVKNNTIHMHDDCLTHCSQKYLSFNTNTLFPYMSLVRALKYQDRGYVMPKAQMMRIGLACSGKVIDSWESAEEQFGGMYQDVLELSRYKDEDFSEELLQDYLSEISREVVLAQLPHYVVKEESKSYLAQVQVGVREKAWVNKTEDGVPDILITDSEHGFKSWLLNDENTEATFKDLTLKLRYFDVQGVDFLDEWGDHFVESAPSYYNSNYLPSAEQIRHNYPHSGLTPVGRLPSYREGVVFQLHKVEGQYISRVDDGVFYVEASTLVRQRCCDAEVENLKQGLILHEMAYPEYVEERREKD